MLHVSRRDRGASCQCNARNLRIANIDRPSLALTLGGKDCRGFGGGDIEWRDAAFQIFVNETGEGLLECLAATSIGHCQ